MNAESAGDRISAAQLAATMSSEDCDRMESLLVFLGELEERIGQLLYDDDVKSAVIDAGEDCTIELGKAIRRLAESRDVARGEAEAATRALSDLRERVRSMVSLAYPDEMTPTAKRLFDSLLEEADNV